MRQSYEKPFDAGDATSNPLNSSAIDIRQIYSFSVIMKSSNGANAGTLKIQVSNDQSNGAIPFVPATATWMDLPTASQDGTGVVASGANVTLFAKQLCYAWARLVWTPSGGAAGTITAYVNTQGF